MPMCLSFGPALRAGQEGDAYLVSSCDTYGLFDQANSQIKVTL